LLKATSEDDDTVEIKKGVRMSQRNVVKS